MLNRLLMGTALLALSAGPAQAQISGDAVKIGVLTDKSGLYADVSGEGSVIAAQMAVEDFGGKAAGKPVQIISADHQNKADISSNIARQWYDVDQVDVILDVPNSAVALAVHEVTREKNKVFINSGAATSDLTGA
jgi:branched-chain amino acid transport system substrate-binding protein